MKNDPPPAPIPPFTQGVAIYQPTNFWLDNFVIIGEVFPESCAGDIDADGNVGSTDLALVLGGWGPTQCADFDLTGDGVVSASDLAIVLGAWGPCPEE